MEIHLIPRTLQDGTFTKFDVSEIKEKMYLAYIVYKIASHRDLRIDSNSYNYFFSFSKKNKNLEKLNKWINNNKEI